MPKFKINEEVVCLDTTDEYVKYGTKGVVLEDSCVPYVRWDSDLENTEDRIWAIVETNLERVVN